MISEMPAHPDEGALPARLAEPEDYHLGMNWGDRPLARNLIVFERLSAGTLFQRRLANRMHHRFVLMRVLRAGGTVSVDGRSVGLAEGDGLLVEPYQFHHYTETERGSLRWIFITFELERGEEALRPLAGRVLRFDDGQAAAWERIVREWARNDPGVLPATDALLQRLLNDGGGSARRAAGGVGDPWLSEARALIVRSVRERWTLAEVARRLGLSDRRLRGRFEALTGVSPKSYRANYQFHLALTLIRDSSLRISEVAERSGFQSPSVFNRFLRRMAGATPRELRRHMTAGGAANCFRSSPPRSKFSWF